jgi:hypothetical protein
MEQNSVGETDGHPRGLVFRKKCGDLALLEDEMGTHVSVQCITDYANIYGELKEDEAFIVEIVKEPTGGRRLKDIAIMSFCNNFGDTPCSAEEGIQWAIENECRQLVALLYADPELEQ